MSELSPLKMEAMPVARCSICGGSHNEDTVLLCGEKSYLNLAHFYFITFTLDGDKQGIPCANEIHMACLNPPLLVVPEGNWYCPECCDENFQRDIIQQYFQDIQHQRFDYCHKNQVLHSSWLEYHYNSYRPLLDWTPCQRLQLPWSEITSTLPLTKIIGYQICIQINQKLIRGRVISFRYDERLCFYEHLIQFKSGNGDLNSPLILWINIEEHDALLGGDVVWVKRNHGYPWQLGQIYYRSGLYFLKRQIEINSERKLIRIFEDNTSLEIPESSIESFNFYEGKMKSRSSRRTNISFALAMIEVEEQENAKRAFQYFTPQQLIKYGGLPDGMKLHHLKSFSDNPSTIYGQFEIKHAYNMCSASHDISARLKRGNILALDGLYMLDARLLPESFAESERLEESIETDLRDDDTAGSEAGENHHQLEVDLPTEERDLSAEQITELERFVEVAQETAAMNGEASCPDRQSEEFAVEENEGSVSSGEVGDFEGSVDNSVDLSGVFQQVELQ